MAKSLFKNYEFDFDKNEAKIITTFCKQAVKQMSTDTRFNKDIQAFNSIVYKVSTDPANVKLTKDEKTRLVNQISENVKHIEKQLNKSWFIKRWMYRSMHNQYISLLNKHFG